MLEIPDLTFFLDDWRTGVGQEHRTTLKSQVTLSILPREKTPGNGKAATQHSH
ncbi:unnamed protein product [Lepidochelys kempii]